MKNYLLSFLPILILFTSCQQTSNTYSLHRVAWEASGGSADSSQLSLIAYDSSAFPYRPEIKKEIQGLLLKYAGRSIYHHLNNDIDAVVFGGGLAVDADGAPTAYHPDDTGLDALAHAGTEGNWWALATDNDLPSGNPIIQSGNDPAPGYYVSMTSLSQPDMSPSNPNKYVDASSIPYFVLPGTVRGRTKMALGDIGLVYNSKNQKYSYAIFADTGPEGKLGEGSIALAKTLGVNDNPRTGGTSGGIVYLLFSGSGDGLPKSNAEIDAIGKKYFQKWGGMKHLQDLLNPKQ